MSPRKRLLAASQHSVIRCHPSRASQTFSHWQVLDRLRWVRESSPQFACFTSIRRSDLRIGFCKHDLVNAEPSLKQRRLGASASHMWPITSLGAPSKHDVWREEIPRTTSHRAELAEWGNRFAGRTGTPLFWQVKPFM